jgi:hypothetical protein
MPQLSSSIRVRNPQKAGVHFAAHSTLFIGFDPLLVFISKRVAIRFG